ncbi:MAG: amidase family protein [Azospirillaceae bacterium]
MDRERETGPPPADGIRRPTREEIGDIAARERFSPDPAALEELHANVLTMLDLIGRLDTLPQPSPPSPSGGRDPGTPSTPESDPHRVFIRHCHVAGAAEGPLAGWRVGLKDNIKVAGVPMTNGSRLIEDYVPRIDAIVVERLLAAGATIVGKLNMDDWSFSGTGETSAFGCTTNPYDETRSAGGSSSGAGAAVALGLVDLALGVDQGGSGRIPASWCGAVSLKATHGLIPTFGLTYLEHTTDFICPTAATVERVATALEVLAGDDPRDPQFVRGPIEPRAYSRLMEGGIDGLRVGIVAQSTETPGLEYDVREAFESATDRFARGGAKVETVEVPYWSDARTIWNGFITQSLLAMIDSNLEGVTRKGCCDTDFQEAFAAARAAGGAERFPPVLKTLLVTGRYLGERHGGVYFSKATNLRHRMRLDMDTVLERFDILLTPTTPMKAFRLLDHAATMTDVVRERAASMCHNTYPTNVTGHPSLTLPCARGEGGLPIGLQIIGRTFDEATVLRAGHAFEGLRGPWRHAG